MKQAISNALKSLKQAVTESSYEIFRKDFECSLEGASTEKNADGTYTDPQTEDKWQKLCDSKTDTILQQW